MTDRMELDAADERDVRTFMTHLAAAPVPAALRDPMPLWWKAQLLKRWDAERRVQAPLDVMERVEIAAGIAATVLLIVWVAPQLLRLFS